MLNLKAHLAGPQAAHVAFEAVQRAETEAYQARPPLINMPMLRFQLLASIIYFIENVYLVLPWAYFRVLKQKRLIARHCLI